MSPFDGDKLDDNSGPDDPCPILRQQVAPLEAMLEGVATGVDHFIVLGDFNRNLWHEENLVTGAEAVRSDGTIDLTTPRPPNVRTRNLLREVNDATPAASEAVLQPVTCAGSAAIAAAREASRTQKLTSAQMATLTATNALGCRNPVGLDHVLVSKSLAPSVTSTTKIAIGASGRPLGPNPPHFLEPLLAVSDHCPIVVEINF